jgi:hypothetical protein
MAFRHVIISRLLSNLRGNDVLSSRHVNGWHNRNLSSRLLLDLVLSKAGIVGRSIHHIDVTIVVSGASLAED